MQQLLSVLLFFCFVNHTDSPAKTSGNSSWRMKTVSSPVSKPVVHYYYHSGWSIETDAHILIFDFIIYPKAGIEYSTLRDRLMKQNATGKKVYFFISHEHDDHFNKDLFDIQQVVKNVTFVLGWKYSGKPAFAYDLKPGDSLYTNDIKINTHISTDAGSAFLVRVDGYTFYHAGDHALWSAAQEKLFTRELQQINRYAGAVDLAFLTAARGMKAGCSTTETILKGIRMSAEILKPSVIALQHIGCDDQLPQYKAVYQQLDHLADHWIIPRQFNESFDL